MHLITDSIRDQLLANWRIGQLAEENGVDHDPKPVVKFFNPVGGAALLITEMVADEPDLLFGLCDLAMGFPEIGYVSLQELESIKLVNGLFKIERDLNFTAKQPISVYVHAARANGQITYSERALLQAKAALDAEKKRSRQTPNKKPDF